MARKLVKVQKQEIEIPSDFGVCKEERMNEVSNMICWIDETEMISPSQIQTIRTKAFQRLPCFNLPSEFTKKQRTVQDIIFCLEFYKELTNKINEKVRYIPIIEDFSCLLGISRTTLNKYRNTRGQEYEDAINMVYDYVGGYISQGTMMGSIKEVSGIFAMKSTLGYRDQDMQVNINNNTLNIHESTDDLMKRFYALKAESKDK